MTDGFELEGPKPRQMKQRFGEQSQFHLESQKQKAQSPVRSGAEECSTLLSEFGNSLAIPCQATRCLPFEWLITYMGREEKIREPINWSSSKIHIRPQDMSNFMSPPSTSVTIDPENLTLRGPNCDITQGTKGEKGAYCRTLGPETSRLDSNGTSIRHT